MIRKDIKAQGGENCLEKTFCAKYLMFIFLNIFHYSLYIKKIVSQFVKKTEILKNIHIKTLKEITPLSLVEKLNYV